MPLLTGAPEIRQPSVSVRHAGYGVTAAHYDTAERALLWALAQCLAEAFSAAAEQAWRRFYRALADAMIAAELDDQQYPR